jgi:hypothetical protein
MIVQGVDSNSNVIPLLLDASGNVIVSASQLTTTGGKIKVDSSGRMTITADEPNYINPVGVVANYSNLSLSAGTSNQTIYTIPTSQKMYLTTASLLYVGTVAGVKLQAYVIVGGSSISFFEVTPVVSFKLYFIYVNILLNAGDKFNCEVSGATLNDDFYGQAAFQRIQ